MKTKTHIDPNDLRLLLQVVQHGGYSAAARALGVSKSTISQRVAALERAVATGLLQRTSRSHSLTDAGRLLLPFAQVIEQQLREAEQAIDMLSSGLTGMLRLVCSSAVAQFALIPAIPRFLREHPAVDIRIDVTDRPVDLIGEGYDMGLLAHGATFKDSSLRQRTLARVPQGLYAAPAWLSLNKVPEQPLDLSELDVLFFMPTPSRAAWTLQREGIESVVPLQPRLCSDDMLLLRNAAIEGSGIVALPTFMIGTALQDELLTPILSRWSMPFASISALSPSRTQSSALRQIFSDFIADELGKLLGSETLFDSERQDGTGW